MRQGDTGGRYLLLLVRREAAQGAQKEGRYKSAEAAEAPLRRVEHRTTRRGQSITEATAKQCEAKARAILAGFIEAKKAAPKMTIYAALEENSSGRKSVRKSAIIFPMLYALYPLPLRCRGGLFLSPRTALLRRGAPCRGILPFPSRSPSRRRMW